MPTVYAAIDPGISIGTYRLVFTYSETAVDTVNNTSKLSYSVTIEKTSAQGFAYNVNTPRKVSGIQYYEEALFEVAINNVVIASKYTQYDFRLNGAQAATPAGTTSGGFSGISAAIPHDASGNLSIVTNARVTFSHTQPGIYVGPLTTSSGANGNTGNKTVIGTHIDRVPNDPTITSVIRTGTAPRTISVEGSATVPSGSPAIDYYQWSATPTIGSTSLSPSFLNNAGTTETWTFADPLADYRVTLWAHSPAGFSVNNDTAIAYAPPVYTQYSMPIKATVGAPYVGSVTVNNGDTFAVQSGSLPPGLQLAGRSVVGIPTTPGVYTFTIRATRSVSGQYTDSLSMVITVVNGAPKVLVGGSFTRSTLKVYNNGAWVSAWMRIYDSAYIDPVDGSHWRPIL